MPCSNRTSKVRSLVALAVSTIAGFVLVCDNALVTVSGVTHDRLFDDSDASDGISKPGPQQFGDALDDGLTHAERRAATIDRAMDAAINGMAKSTARLDDAIALFEASAARVAPVLERATTARHDAVDDVLTALAADNVPSTDACRETARALTATPLRVPALTRDARREREQSDAAEQAAVIEAFFALDVGHVGPRLVDELGRVDTGLEDELVRLGFRSRDDAEPFAYDAPDVDTTVDLAAGRARTIERLGLGLAALPLVRSASPAVRHALGIGARGASHVARAGRVSSPVALVGVTAAEGALVFGAAYLNRRSLANELCRIASEEQAAALREDGSDTLRGQLEAFVEVHDDIVEAAVLRRLAHHSVSG